jgi:hypothetical protein
MHSAVCELIFNTASVQQCAHCVLPESQFPFPSNCSLNQIKEPRGTEQRSARPGVPSISIDIECDSLLTAVTACKQTKITVAIDLAPGNFPSTHIFRKIPKAFSS